MLLIFLNSIIVYAVNRGDSDSIFAIGQTLRIRIGPLMGWHTSLWCYCETRFSAKASYRYVYAGLGLDSSNIRTSSFVTISMNLYLWNWGRLVLLVLSQSDVNPYLYWLPFYFIILVYCAVGEVKVVADMHQRNAEMARHFDVFIALPG